MSDRIPKVSIGLPVYNGEKYLACGLESILAQTFDDFELIISDNGSTDATREIACDYASRDGRIRYYREEANRGATWNFNRVYQLSRGEYFKWSAHDDILAPAYLAQCVEVLDADPSVVWCQTRIDAVDSRGRVVEGHDRHKLNGAAEPLPPPASRGRPQLAASPATGCAHRRFRKVLLGNSSCLDVYGLIRTADLRCTSLWKPCFGWEKVLIGELALRGRCAEIPDKLFLYRIHEDACSALASASALNAWCSPSARMPSNLARFRLLAGHIHAALHAPIGYRQRALCLCWIGAYLCQFRKWPTALGQILRKQGMGGGTRETLNELHPQEQPGDDVLEMAGHVGAAVSQSTNWK